MRNPQKLAVLTAGLVTIFTLPVFTIAVMAEPAHVWTDQHDGGAAMTDDGICLLSAPDGHLIVGGESTDPIPGSDVFIRKLSHADGAELWSVRQEGIDEKDVAITEMTWDSAGQLLVSAFIRGCIG